MKTNKLKIKMLDNLIDRNVDKIMDLVDKCRENGIRLNQKDNIVVQDINRLSENNTVLEGKLEIISSIMREQQQEKYNNYIEQLKNSYQNNKYKVVDIENKVTTYSNDIKKYIRNFKYEIYCIIENKEYRKQGNFEYIEFKDKDSKYMIQRKESYNKNGELISMHLEKEKKGSKIIYDKTSNNIFFYINGINVFKANKNDAELDKITKAINSFENDKELQELFSVHNKDIYKKEKVIKRTIEDRFEHMLNAYNEAADKNKDLKYICENRDISQDKYLGKENIKKFYKTYKINNENWTNYLGNYNRWKYLKNIDIKEIEKISKESDEFWKYPERVLRWEDYKQMRKNNFY